MDRSVAALSLAGRVRMAHARLISWTANNRKAVPLAACSTGWSARGIVKTCGSACAAWSHPSRRSGALQVGAIPDGFRARPSPGPKPRKRHSCDCRPGWEAKARPTVRSSTHSSQRLVARHAAASVGSELGRELQSPSAAAGLRREFSPARPPGLGGSHCALGLADAVAHEPGGGSPVQGYKG
jgi:hypothetical protein